MTHDPKAVEIVEQALTNYLEIVPHQLPAFVINGSARALLDAITPRIVAAEREACAQVAEAKKKADPSHEDDGWRDFDSGWNNCAKTIFDAIRARKP